MRKNAGIQLRTGGRFLIDFAMVNWLLCYALMQQFTIQQWHNTS